MSASVFLRESQYPQHLPAFRDDLGEKCGLAGGVVPERSVRKIRRFKRYRVDGIPSLVYHPLTLGGEQFSGK
jgi:hypothetical protein